MLRTLFCCCYVGCGSRNSSNPVTELSMPADDVLTSLPDNPDASLMLCDDGTYKIYTPDMDDNLQLLYWEYILTEDYFNEKKEEYRKMAATATEPEYGPDVPAVTVMDYGEYESLTYKKYLKGKFSDLEEYGIRDRFNEWTHELSDRPVERLEISFTYNLRNYEDPSINDGQLVELYKAALQMIFDDPDMLEYVLNSVNMERYKDGSEARDIYVQVSEKEEDSFMVSVTIKSARDHLGDGYFEYKYVQP